MKNMPEDDLIYPPMTNEINEVTEMMIDLVKISMKWENQAKNKV